MIIKESSWHYKAMEFVDIKHSKSLCIYFWQLMLLLPIKVAFALVVLTFFLGAGFAVLSAAVSPLIVPFFFPEAMFNASDDLTGWTEYFSVTFAMGVFGWFIASLFGIFKLIQLGFRWLAGRPIKNASEPTLVGEYIKAKKEKVCPRIRFESR